MRSIHVLGLAKGFAPLAQSGEGLLNRIGLLEEGIALSSDFGIGKVWNTSPIEDGVEFGLQMLKKLFQDSGRRLDFS